MLFGLYSENPSPFEKAVADELLYWLVRNEHLRVSTGSHYRVFSYFAKDILQVNMNCFYDEYLQKFVIPDHYKYMNGLIKKFEPVIFKVMQQWEISEYNIQVDFHIKVNTYHKNVSYKLSSTIE